MICKNSCAWKHRGHLMLTAQVIHNTDNLPVEKRVDIYMKQVLKNAAKTKCLGCVKMKYLGDFF